MDPQHLIHMRLKQFVKTSLSKTDAVEDQMASSSNLDSICTIGRSPDCNLVLRDETVSGLHARLSVSASGELLIEDLGSRNGTYVNGRSVQSCSVRSSDSVQIGKVPLPWQDPVISKILQKSINNRRGIAVTVGLNANQLPAPLAATGAVQPPFVGSFPQQYYATSEASAKQVQRDDISFKLPVLAFVIVVSSIAMIATVLYFRVNFVGGHRTSPANATTQQVPTPMAPATPTVFIEPVIVHAAAPEGTGVFSLGQTYSSSMVPLGVTVYANDSAHLHRADENRYQSESLSIEDQQSLSANASAWHIVSASINAGATERDASLRAFLRAYTMEVDATAMTAQPPVGAVYYLARIAFGHLYEEVVHGDSSAFHAGLSAEFTRVASGSIEGWAQQNRLQLNARGLGMVPSSGQAIFARTSEDVRQGYTATGPDVPIFVDFRSLPTVTPPPDATITWVQPIHLRVDFDRIDVYRNGSIIGSSQWALSTRCSVNNRPPQVRQSAYTGQVVDGGYRTVPGPRGTPTFHPYDLQQTLNLAVVPGDEIRCGVEGSQDNVPIQYSGFFIAVSDSMEPQQSHFAGLDPNTEYWVNYRVSMTQ